MADVAGIVPFQLLAIGLGVGIAGGKEVDRDLLHRADVFQGIPDIDDVLFLETVLFQKPSHRVGLVDSLGGTPIAFLEVRLIGKLLQGETKRSLASPRQKEETFSFFREKLENLFHLWEGNQQIFLSFLIIVEEKGKGLLYLLGSDDLPQDAVLRRSEI